MTAEVQGKSLNTLAQEALQRSVPAWRNGYQAAFNPARPLAGLSPAEVNKALVKISKKIKAPMVDMMAIR